MKHMYMRSQTVDRLATLCELSSCHLHVFPFLLCCFPSIFARSPSKKKRLAIKKHKKNRNVLWLQLIILLLRVPCTNVQSSDNMIMVRLPVFVRGLAEDCVKWKGAMPQYGCHKANTNEHETLTNNPRCRHSHRHTYYLVHVCYT